MRRVRNLALPLSASATADVVANTAFGDAVRGGSCYTGQDTPTPDKGITMHWTTEDIRPGTAISKRRSAANPHFLIPALIVRTPHADSEEGWGICELSDGLITGYGASGSFGTKEELAARLTEMGYFAVPKMVFNGSLGTLPENRVDTPVIILTHCKY
jgi:hypothetical protein